MASLGPYLLFLSPLSFLLTRLALLASVRNLISHLLRPLPLPRKAIRSACPVQKFKLHRKMIEGGRSEQEVLFNLKSPFATQVEIPTKKESLRMYTPLAAWRRRD